ncbi:MAG: hypothetical protein QOD72_3680 [Acidimicrobiaceae bacterium]|jgi:uncharacterized protein (DUF427 family)|nr:hypothetical protein [Acidimicrobiaceae bacterium]
MTTRTEVSPKRVRALLDGRVVADSRDARLVWRNGPPVYAFPEGDVDRAAVPEDVIKVDNELPGLLMLRWSAIDMWLEEDEPVFVHPRDPYVRVDVLDGSRHVRLKVGDIVVAESHRPRIVFETNLPPRFYLPRTDVRLDLLKPTATTTQCPYKGTASYWSVTAGGVTVDDAVWSYAVARPEVAKIAGMMCFYDEKVLSTVDGERQSGLRR